MKHIIVKIFTVFFLVSIMYAGDIKEGVNAPLFVGMTKDGQVVRLENYRGKVVILDFWASWCGPCQHEFPFLIDLKAKNTDTNFVILAVNIDRKISQAVKFLDKLDKKPGFPIIFDDKSEIPPMYQLETMPTTFFIDKTGIIRYIHSGFTDSFKTSYENELNELLKE
jgi:thiol-disulfide isomerase/thioredoxin